MATMAQRASIAVNRIDLKILSDPANLREVRKLIENFAQSVGMEVQGSEDIGLTLNEALANVIRHGYGGATDRPIEVSAEARKGEFRMSIRDWAKPFDPSKVPQRCGGELTPGGLGLLCIRKLMDEVKYERLADGMLLTMIKRIQ
jgi:anti-sigma regulatory factor (Ser/Thr protein kinase)